MADTPHASAPYMPPQVTVKPPALRTPGLISHRDIRAISNCWKGEATAEEQRLALETVVYTLARADDLGYFPDNRGGERDSSFLQGMRHVGMQLRKFAMLGTAYLTADEDPDPKTAPTPQTRAPRKSNRKRDTDTQEPYITD